MKPSDIRPTVIKVMPSPCNPSGMSLYFNFSRMPASAIIASAQPRSESEKAAAKAALLAGGAVLGILSEDPVAWSGRYWGWDPKETWALISILVYAFVLHMRLIPKMRGTWLFNLMSIIAFASIVMTYFGVNFYLVGLHSYASGDKVITPDFVYYSIVFVLILGIISKWRYNKFLSK